VAKRTGMPQGSKASYSGHQRRMAHKIERSAKRRGKSAKTAARIGWATVNKRTGGAHGRRKRPSRGGKTKRSHGRSHSSRSRSHSKRSHH